MSIPGVSISYAVVSMHPRCLPIVSIFEMLWLFVFFFLNHTCIENYYVRICGVAQFLSFDNSRH